MIHPPSFYKGLAYIAGHLGAQPLDLLQVMMAEGGVRADAWNEASGASGLIQFMPSTLKGLGWAYSPEQFRSLTAEQQLPWVGAYFEPYRAQGLYNTARLYQAVFLPATLSLGSSDHTIITSPNGPYPAAYASNRAVDWNNKGFITVGDLAHAVLERCVGERWETMARELLQATMTTGGPQMIAPDITRLSPNVTRSANGVPVPMPASTKTVIIHCTRSGKSMNPTEFEGTLNYMQDPAPGGNPAAAVSCQWVVARAGLKARVVLDTQIAWHASEDNDNAWGIELEQGVESDGFADAQLGSLLDICRGYMADFGVPPVHARSSTEPGFIGHEETAQGKRSGKSDPGDLFPWEWFIAQLSGAAAPPAQWFTELEAYQATGSVMHFRRMGYNLGDILQRERDIFRAIAGELP